MALPQPRHSDPFCYPRNVTGGSQRVPWLTLFVVYTLLLGFILFAFHLRQRTEPIEPRQTIPVFR